MATKQQRFTRDDLAAAILRLPAGATVDDAIECLEVIRDIELGIADVEAGRTVSQDEVERRIASWFK